MKLLKTIFWFLIAVLTAHTLTSCDKEEVKPQTWYLDISFLDYRAGNMPAKSIGDNIGADGSVIGQSMDFEDESLRCRLYTYDVDSIYQITGVIDGKPFIVLDGKMNICGGQQGIECNYKLEFE